MPLPTPVTATFCACCLRTPSAHPSPPVAQRIPCHSSGSTVLLPLVHAASSYPCLPTAACLHLPYHCFPTLCWTYHSRSPVLDLPYVADNRRHTTTAGSWTVAPPLLVSAFCPPPTFALPLRHGRTVSQLPPHSALHHHTFATLPVSPIAACHFTAHRALDFP